MLILVKTKKTLLEMRVRHALILRRFFALRARSSSLASRTDRAIDSASAPHFPRFARSDVALAHAHTQERRDNVSLARQRQAATKTNAQPPRPPPHGIPPPRHPLRAFCASRLALCV